MQFLHFVLLPLLFFILMSILQQWANDEDFTQMFKMYGIGILAGIIIKIFFSMFNPIFENKAHHFTIFMKSLFIDGILFSVIVIISFYILLDFLSNISSNLNWLWSTLFFLGYILGIFSIINAIDSYYCYYPNSPLFYLSFISFILLISFITGLGIYLFNETYNLIIKILIASFTILFVAILSMIFNYLKFYDYYEYLYFIIPAVIFSIIFEFKEFRYIRN